MKPNNLMISEVETTVTGKRLHFGVREEDMPHLMAVLSSVYSDPTGAVAREYITNALDSHVEAGQTRPVEVTTPGLWSPNLVIQDFGIGMDAESMEEIFINYGRSTKRDSDDFNGTLGIGAKSAYAYSNSFTIVGVKNGVKTTAAAGRDEIGAPTLDIIDVSNTDEGNGVTITIPCNRAGEMSNAVKRVAAYLPEGALLVDGKDLSARSAWTLIGSNIKDDKGNVVILNLWRHPSNDYATGKIVMGNVAYTPVSDIIPGNVYGRYRQDSVVAEVAMGAVVFAPDRESLQDVLRTQKTEEFVRKSVSTLMCASIQQAIDDAPSMFEALKIYSEESGVISTYNGVVSRGGKFFPKMTSHIIERDYTKHDSIACRTYAPNTSSAKKAGNLDTLYYQNVVDAAAVIINAPDKSFTSTSRRKMEQWAESVDITKSNAQLLVFSNNAGALRKNEWLKGLKFIEWSDIEAQVLPAALRSGNGGGVKTKGKYHVLESGGTTILRELTSADDNIYFFNLNQAVKDWNLQRLNIGAYYGDEETRRFGLVNKIIDLVPSGATVITVYANRVEKFKRDYPQAQELTFSLLHGMLVKHTEGLLTDDEIIVAGARQVFNSGLRGMTLIPKADPDIHWYYKSLGEIDANALSSIVMVLNDDHPKIVSFRKAQSDARKAYEAISNRYPSLALTSRGWNPLSDTLTRRYIDADYRYYLTTI